MGEYPPSHDQGHLYARDQDALLHSHTCLVVTKSQTQKQAVTDQYIKCNTIIYLCLCGSLPVSVQEGKREIIYQFRQHGYAWQSLGNLVTMNFFKVFEYQVGMSGMFECHN